MKTTIRKKTDPRTMKRREIMALMVAPFLASGAVAADMAGGAIGVGKRGACHVIRMNKPLRLTRGNVVAFFDRCVALRRQMNSRLDPCDFEYEMTFHMDRLTAMDVLRWDFDEHGSAENAENILRNGVSQETIQLDLFKTYLHNPTDTYQDVLEARIYPSNWGEEVLERAYFDLKKKRIHSRCGGAVEHDV